MPYIKKEDREPFVPLLNDLALVVARRGLSNGELNWLLTKVALQYLLAHGITYDTLSDVIKAFECAKLEFARRMIAPYEDTKRAQNGNVY